MASDSRPRLGLACEECRRRKTKCDGERPCGLCLEFRVECVFEDNRSKRGPKKGQLGALKARIAMLELQLSSQLAQHTDFINRINATAGSPMNGADLTMHSGVPQAYWCRPFETASETTYQAGWQNNLTASDLQLRETLLQPEEVTIPPLQNRDAANERLDSAGLSPLMKLDLDQLYFDRVHPQLPMIHRSCYLSWANFEDVPLAQKCLQWAMRAMAAAMSSQFRSKSDEFYHRAIQLAEELEARDLVLRCLDSNARVKIAQTWLLLAHYELLDPFKYSRSTTKQRAFHLVHLWCLHCTDSKHPTSYTPSYGSQTSLSTTSEFASMEEQRRTFWVAFCLDRFLGGYEGSQTTILDETISVRLPCPEWNFQASNMVNMGFANDVLIRGIPVPASSSFARLVVSMALFGKCAQHKRISTTYPISYQESLAFWTRHEWLAKATGEQLALLSPESTGVDDEPLRLMTSMAIHGSVVILSNAIDAIDWGVNSQLLTASNYAKTACDAANVMADLAKSITDATCFKTHLYLPMFLVTAFLYLDAHPDLGGDQQTGKTKMIDWLNSIKDIHGQAEQFISRLQL